MKQRSGLSTVDHYLDDFFFAGRNHKSCVDLMNTFKQICQELGVPLAEDKSFGPTYKLVFLGLEIDTVSQMVRVLEVKSAELSTLLQEMLRKKRVTLLQLQSLLGKLNFFTKAIVPGRVFVRRMHDATLGVRKPHHFVRVNQEMKQDMGLWLTFLEEFNGRVYFSEVEWSSNLVLDLFTDSAGAGNFGCGAYFQGNGAIFHGHQLG